MDRFLTKRNVFVLIVLLAGIFLSMYIETRPRIAPGQEPLTDITNIETLRTQFNRHEGHVRLILLASPT
jgi:hypothetical protein